MEVTYYMRPDGRMKTIDMTLINDEDEKFFVENDYVVSMEQLMTGDIVVYARPSDMDEEDEVMVFDRGRGCPEVIKELREICEKTFENA